MHEFIIPFYIDYSSYIIVHIFIHRYLFTCKLLRKSPLGTLINYYISSIDDHQLDEMNTVASSQHPGIGMRMLQGNLTASGHCIQHERIRMSLLQIDAIGVVQRWQQTVKRCHYRVRSPLALWHTLMGIIDSLG